MSLWRPGVLIFFAKDSICKAYFLVSFFLSTSDNTFCRHIVPSITKDKIYHNQKVILGFIKLEIRKSIIFHLSALKRDLYVRLIKFNFPLKGQYAIDQSKKWVWLQNKEFPRVWKLKQDCLFLDESANMENNLNGSISSFWKRMFYAII